MATLKQSRYTIALENSKPNRRTGMRLRNGSWTWPTWVNIYAEHGRLDFDVSEGVLRGLRLEVTNDD